MKPAVTPGAGEGLSEGWREPLTLGSAAPGGDPYYCDAKAGAFSLVAFRAGKDGHLMKLWAWEVRGPEHVAMARSERRVPLDEAKRQAEAACSALLATALATLPGAREALEEAMGKVGRR